VNKCKKYTLDEPLKLDMNLDKYQIKINSAYEELIENIKKDYEKEIKWFQKKCFIINPLEEQINIFSAHAETTRERNHTVLLANFFKDIDGLFSFFLEHNLSKKICEEEFSVEEEKLYPEKGDRIDIVLTSKNSVVAIEAKINSKENQKQDCSQMENYEKTINTEYKNKKCQKIFFLTKDKTVAKCSNVKNNVKNISWLEVLALCQAFIFKKKKLNASMYYLQLWISSFLGYIYNIQTAETVENIDWESRNMIKDFIMKVKEYTK